MIYNNKTTLFIDESGKPDFEDKRYKDFLLTGVRIPDSELEVISGYFSYIKRKYNLPSDVPFHTYDLLENPIKKLSISDGRNFIRSMTEFIETCPISIYLVHTNKRKFFHKYKKDIDKIRLAPKMSENKGTVYFLSAYKLFMMFVDYLEEKSDLGQIIADSRYNQDRDFLDAFLRLLDSHFKGGIENPYANKAKQRLTSITFANKFSLTSGLELADFVSFSYFNKIERRVSRFSDINLSKAITQIEQKLVKKKVFEINNSLVKKFV